MKKYILYIFLCCSLSCSIFEDDNIRKQELFEGTYVAYNMINQGVLDKIELVFAFEVTVDTIAIESTDLTLITTDDDTYAFRTQSNELLGFILEHNRQFENSISGKEKPLDFNCEDEFTTACDLSSDNNIRNEYRQVDIPFNVTERYRWSLNIEGENIHLRFERNTDPDGVLGPANIYVQEFKGRFIDEIM